MADDLGPEAGTADGGGAGDSSATGDGGTGDDGGLVDEESDESFPASDAPSWWAGEDPEA